MTSGEASIITELVAKVGELVGRFDGAEQERAVLREADNHWRERMETKTDKMYERLDEMSQTLEAMPRTVDEQIATELSAQHKRRSEQSHRTRSALIILGVICLLSLAAGLEFIDREKVAGAMFATLAVVTPLTIWYLGKRLS